MGRRVWPPAFPSCGWPVHVSSVTMIHLSYGEANTFSEQNVLIFNNRQTSPMVSRPRQRSIQQTAAGRTYESTELTPGILSGKVASPRQLPTDHDPAVPTRAYQSDQSSLSAPRCHLLYLQKEPGWIFLCRGRSSPEEPTIKNQSNQRFYLGLDESLHIRNSLAARIQWFANRDRWCYSNL